MTTECGEAEKMECLGPGWCVNCAPLGSGFADPAHPDNFRNRRKHPDESEKPAPDGAGIPGHLRQA